jgi:predicted RNase H-like HicB family nuclease
MSENKYPFNIAWSEEDGEYVATCPAFPGLSALGETEEEALAEAKVALRLFIKSCEERGIPLPEPQTVQQYSGQFRVRLPKSLHAQAARMAEADGISLNQFVVGAVEAKVIAKEISADVKRVLEEHTASLAWNQGQAGANDRQVVKTERTEVTTERFLTVSPLTPKKGN